MTRNYPHTPGIDAAGVVEASSSDEFHPGQMVLIAAEEMGANWPGGYAGYIHVPAGWLVPLPEALTAWESMALGTAGFTAAICVDRLLWAGVQPSQGEVLVTGATGGVGSFALALLAKEGFQAVAATGKLDQAEYLSDLGAGRVIHRDEVIDTSGKPLLSGRWAGVIDTVGGPLLASAIKAVRIGGSVAACGNVASPRLETTVFPFILRGVNLLGIDSANYPIERRRALWQRLAGAWRLDVLEHMSREVPVNQLDREIDRILQGKQIGRVVVAHR